jgi:hypothetical protein
VHTLYSVSNPHKLENKDVTSNSMTPQLLQIIEDNGSASDAAKTTIEKELTNGLRSHSFYKRQPDKDGMYRCPKKDESGCSHRPTTHKKVYKRYIDSHLKPFRCSEKDCTMSFARRYPCEQHVLTHGTLREKIFCTVAGCGTEYATRANMIRHVRQTHEALKKFECLVCDRAFARKQTLQV